MCFCIPTCARGKQCQWILLHEVWNLEDDYVSWEGRKCKWGPSGRYAGVGRCLWRKVSLVPCTPRNTTSVSNCQASADFCLCVHPIPKLLLSPISLGSRETSTGNPGEGKREKAVSSSESISLKMLQVWGKKVAYLISVYSSCRLVQYRERIFVKEFIKEMNWKPCFLIMTLANL